MVSDGEHGRPELTRKREYDEDDVRVRPGPSSRPRTHRRPKHADATEGFVVTVDRGRYTCFVAPDTVVTAMRARELGRRGVVVGDRVQIVGDVSGKPDTLARIVRIEERDSVLMRTADDEEGDAERVVVANAEQLVIVSSLADPPPRTGFIDRCLVAAYDAEIDPLLCLTKADLAGPRDVKDVLDYYAELDLPHVLCRPDEPLIPLLEELAGRVSVLIGHSGVGKSTLVNRIVPDAFRAVGVVSAVGKGRHTSTSLLALRLPAQPQLEQGGWIIDTPGIRSFGLAHVSADSLLHGFPDLVEASTRCPANCDHTGAGGTCGLDALVAEGGADPRRLASYRRLLASRSGVVDDSEVDHTST
jgi:ribosome biogenesis GTPase / thiamine phosphate phosphatase